MSKPHPIIKVPAEGIYVRDLIEKLPSVEPGFKFGLKIKRGTRWKLRSFRIAGYEARTCESCGPYVSLSFRNSLRDFHFDNHFGPSYLTVSTLLGC